MDSEVESKQTPNRDFDMAYRVKFNCDLQTVNQWEAMVDTLIIPRLVEQVSEKLKADLNKWAAERYEDQI